MNERGRNCEFDRKGIRDMKFDMHCHTKEGSLDGKVPIEAAVVILKEKGFGGMLISDHNSYKGYRAWKKRCGDDGDGNFVVLKGVEYDTIDAGHILVIMPEDVKLRILELRGLPVQFLIEIVHKYGGILGPAHPCGEKYLSITNTRKHRNRMAVMDQFDFLEGFNACEGPESNGAAMEIAAMYGKPVFGGSDAHKADCMGLGYTEFQSQINSESDLIRLVKEMGREACACGGEYYANTTKQRIGRANDLLVDGFWFYNWIGSLLKYRKRRHELSKYYIRLK